MVRILHISVCFLFAKIIICQQVEFSFAASYTGQPVVLDSVYVQNLTQGGDTSIDSPDTILLVNIFSSIGLKTGNSPRFSCHPNPFEKITSIGVITNEPGMLNLLIFSASGAMEASFSGYLKPGKHTFIFQGAERGLYFCKLFTGEFISSLKIINTNPCRGKSCTLLYDHSASVKSGFDHLNGFVFNPGDQIRFTGFVVTPDGSTGSDLIEDTPNGNSFYQFEASKGIPCREEPYLEYAGQTYQTIRIGEQCWFRQNLNIGERIDGIIQMTNNGVIEKYCYDDDETNCDIYGGLYQWRELMQYVSVEPGQGLCPDGWHIPDDFEWSLLEGTVDSVYPPEDPIWNTEGMRGYNAAGELKEEGFDHWAIPNTGATNNYGFTMLPAGNRFHDGTSYNFLHTGTYLWSSTAKNDTAAYGRTTGFTFMKSGRFGYPTTIGISARCLRNE